MKRIKEHNINLNFENITLRPLTENDWKYLYKWNNDIDVLYYSECDNVEQYLMEEIQEMYRFISQNAYCFIIEYDKHPIGECWIQKLNLYRLIVKFPNLDCRRIDIMIGEKENWGKGIGTKTIMLLTEYGFEKEQVDIIFGCDIADYNQRSIRAFEKVGFQIYNAVKQRDGQKAKVCYDVILKRDRYEYLKKQGYYRNLLI